ncbi:MAG: hypothetical protein FJX66_11195 [Alphaproteobacteria bacterium]|nr:hypothetical protein [Alphaproteobacteria bacterium]
MRTIGRALIGTVVATALAVGIGLSSLAADLPLKAFFGSYSGSGLARNEESDYFGLTVRDLDVTIKQAGKGFELSWTTVLRQGGDPKKPDVKRKSESVTFVPSSRPGIYVPAKGAGDPVEHGRTTWAHIRNQTLTVNSLSVLDDGGFELQRYDRTLTDLDMELEFLSVHEEGVARKVTGRLIKKAN